MKRFLPSLLVLSLALLASAEKYCFVVTGDGRTDHRAATPDPTGINTPVVKKLFAAIAAEKPKFMLWTGDLIFGHMPNLGMTAKVDEQFKAWKALMPLLPGVTILPSRGNHETLGDPTGAMWLQEIKPILDGAKVTYFAGEEGFSYSWKPSFDPKMMVVALDQYIVRQEVNLPELEKALAKGKAEGVEHFMLYGHEMAFTCSAHEDNLGAKPEKRDAFVNLLQKYNVRYYFAGHDHTYDWMVVKHKSWPADYALNQIVAGTAGAPFYPDKGYFGDPRGFKLTRKEHLDNTYGYVLIEVDTDKKGQDALKVTFKTVTP